MIGGVRPDRGWTLFPGGSPEATCRFFLGGGERPGTSFLGGGASDRTTGFFELVGCARFGSAASFTGSCSTSLGAGALSAAGGAGSGDGRGRVLLRRRGGWLFGVA
jgi:hypothetical protein